MTEESIIAAIQAAGLEEADTVLVHSDISKLGPIVDYGGKKLNLPCTILTYYQAIQHILGDKGTVCVPAFFYDYARKREAFHVDKSKVADDLGLLSKWVADLHGVVRSLNPLTSVASYGSNAEFISGGKTASAYAIDSPFHRLHQKNALMLFIGISPRAMTFVHYVEHMVGVPHLYSKLFEIPIYKNGIPVNLPVSAQVRYQHIDIPLDQEGNNEKLANCPTFRKIPIGEGFIWGMRCGAVFDYLKERLQEDFFYLLKERPKFIPGELPLK